MGRPYNTLAHVGQTILAKRIPPVSFARRLLNPPSELFFTEDQRLILASQYNGLEAIPMRLKLRGEVLTPGGEIVPIEEEHICNTDRTTNRTFHAIGSGFLLGLYLDPVTNSLPRGAVYVNCAMGIGSAGTYVPTRSLFADYVSGSYELGWPPGVLRDPTEGRGYIRRIDTGGGALGSPVTLTVPNRTLWRPLGAYCILDTSAVAANRLLYLEGLAVTDRVFMSRAPAVTAANATQEWVASLGINEQAVLQQLGQVPMPADAFLGPGDQLGWGADNLQAGDQFTAAVFVVEEWLLHQ